MYLADSNAFVKIISDSPAAVDRHIHEVPESLINFYDISEQEKIIINKFLHHIDNTLSLVLDAYHLPLFILGTEGIVHQFKDLTKHSGAVIEYVCGSYEEAGIEQLKEILEPYTTNWKKVWQKNLSNQLREAAVNRKLAVGMSDVWHEAMKGNGRLLIIEKNFIYGAEHESIDDIIFKAVKQYDRFSYIKNTLDDVIEKVLESGGDVEFVDKEVVKDYHHIVMIKFY